MPTTAYHTNLDYLSTGRGRCTTTTHYLGGAVYESKAYSPVPAGHLPHPCLSVEDTNRIRGKEITPCPLRETGLRLDDIGPGSGYLMADGYFYSGQSIGNMFFGTNLDDILGFAPKSLFGERL